MRCKLSGLPRGGRIRFRDHYRKTKKLHHQKYVVGLLLLPHVLLYLEQVSKCLSSSLNPLTSVYTSPHLTYKHRSGWSGGGEVLTHRVNPGWGLTVKPLVSAKSMVLGVTQNRQLGKCHIPCISKVANLGIPPQDGKSWNTSPWWRLAHSLG